MESRNNGLFRVSTLAAAIALAYAFPAHAEENEIDQYIKPDSSVSVGVGLQDKDRRQLGIFDGRQDDGASLLIDADIRKRDDATGTWNELKLYNLGLDNRELFLGHSRQGNYGLSFEYSRMPREVPYQVHSGLAGAGTAAQTVNQVAPGAGNEIHLGTRRDRYTIGLNKFLGETLEVTFKYRQEEKEGKRIFGAYTGSIHKFLTEPIDSSTRQFEAMLNYVGKELQLQGGYYGSWYNNSAPMMVGTDPTTTPPGNYNPAFISLAPDNKAHQFFLHGAYSFSPTTTGTLRLARTSASQDDDSMMNGLGAINPALVWAGFSGVKAKVVTSDVQFGLSSHPVKNLSLTAHVHYNDRDDRTPHIAYNSVNDETTPHSFTNLNARFEAAYRVMRDLRLLGGVYLESRERSIPFKEFDDVPAAPSTTGGNWTVPAVTTNEREVPYRFKAREITYKAQATKNFSETFNGALVLSHGKRDGSHFYWADQQNLISPLHMADRDRDKLGLKMDWSPTEKVSVQAQFARTRDDYGTNGLNGDRSSNGFTLLGTGLRDGGAKLFSLDTMFTLNDDWHLSAWYSRDDTDATQYAFQNNFGADPIRKSHLRDVGDSFGLGVKGQVSGKLMLGADLQWNRTDSKYRQNNSNDQANMIEGLPTLTNKVVRLSLNGTYEVDKKSSVRVDAIHDRWSTNDWT